MTFEIVKLYIGFFTKDNYAIWSKNKMSIFTIIKIDILFFHFI
jgi:hypothetical protein